MTHDSRCPAAHGGANCTCDRNPSGAEENLKTALGLLDEVASVFTRHDDLPDNLLPRIDEFLAANNKPQRPEGS